jgi:eukaryotic-like serine/threonine-protein kinase
VIGETINGQYRIVRQLGSGGMGVVFEADDLTRGRKVAIKIISNASVLRESSAVSRFHREAKAASAIATEHIVRVLDTGTTAAEQPYMVMEYLAGEDLAQLLGRVGALAPDAALRIAAQLCFAVQKAHEARVVHRDIKPANLFLSERAGGEILVKVLDFGVAKIRMEHGMVADTTGLTKSGSMIGSPLYMAPEQARGAKDVDHRADVWSIGVVLYQMLVGHAPHHEYTGLGELVLAICSDPAPPIRDLAPWVPPEIADLAHRALRLRLAERFQTAEEMLKAIRAHLPDGWALRRELLVGVTDTEKSAPPVPSLVSSADVPTQVLIARKPPPIDDPTPRVDTLLEESSADAPTLPRNRTAPAM